MASSKKKAAKKSTAKPAPARSKAKPAAKSAKSAKSASPKPKPVKAKPAAKPAPAVRSPLIRIGPLARASRPPAPVTDFDQPTPRTSGGKADRPAPSKPVFDSEWLASMREALASQRQRLKAMVQMTQAQLATKEGDLADVSDRASEGFEDELDMGLMAIEAAQLEDIDAAIQRIDDGSYGICLDCERPIPRKRLDVLPFARRCLACEGQAERRIKSVDEEETEEDAD